MKGVIDGGKFTYANGANAAFLENLYKEYKNNPDAVDPSWKLFFEGYEFASSSSKGPSVGGGRQDDSEARVEHFINLFRRLGHLSSHLNPLAGKPALASDLLPAK